MLAFFFFSEWGKRAGSFQCLLAVKQKKQNSQLIDGAGNTCGFFFLQVACATVGSSIVNS